MQKKPNLYNKINIRNLRIFCCFMLVLCLCASMLVGCNNNKTSGKNFRFPLDQDPRQIDPQRYVNSSSVEVIMSLFEGLTTLSEDGKPLPGMAEWAVSADGLKYTFTLKESWWSDYKTKDEDGKEIPGTKVTAADFVFGFKRSLSKTNPQSFASDLFVIKNAKEIYEGKKDISELGVASLSENQLEIELTAPSDSFLTVLSTPSFMPCNEKFFNATSGRYGMAREFLLTNGPFKLRNWVEDESVLLNKHHGFYSASEVSPAAVRYVVSDVVDPINSLTNELIDAAQISKIQLEDAKKNKLISLEQNDVSKMLVFNTSKNHLSNNVVRKSLRDSIEWDIIAQTLSKNGSDLSTGFSSPKTVVKNDEVYRTSENTLSNSLNAKKAKTDFENYLKSKKIESIKGLKITCTDDEYSIALSRTIAQSWQKHLSLYVELEIVSQKDIHEKILGDFDMAIFNQIAPSYSAVDALKVFASDSNYNLSKFKDKSFDKLLLELSGDDDNVRDKIESAEIALWDLCPAVPISYENRYIALSKNCVNVIVRPFGGGIHGAVYGFRKAGKTS